MNWQHRLNLEPHPEGGWFRRIYTAAAPVGGEPGSRAAASSIHYLLTAEHPRGRFHRVAPTILHFLQSGGPVEYACIDADGQLQQSVLGFAEGQALFLEVPGGTWKCSRLLGDADHALVSEVVIPAFEWADHEYLDLSRINPALQDKLQQQGWIDRLTE